MSLTGRTIGVYTVGPLIGAGGMGEVYRAHDVRLGRDVALKILPSSLDRDPDRLSRFDREARLLASLTHPHIAVIYGAEDTDGVHALVLELVEGPTLAEKLEGLSAEGKGLPASEALTIARQIADALEAAHRKGIVHRDLKPANIKITPDGRTKVLDFGLAKIAAGTAQDRTHAPTVTVAATREGAIVGTTAYMSPEQARGLAVDQRTDIWAFGCVLFEMLTGRAVFARGTMTDTLAAIIEREPHWDTLPSTTPPAIVRLLHRCLEKNPEQRLHNMADIRLTLDDAEPTSAKPSMRRRWIVAAGVMVLVIGAEGAALLLPRRAQALTDKDTIVLADFTNTTGDAVFDGTLRQGLSVQLGQSPFLSLVSDPKIQQVLGLMGHPADARLTPAIASEVCQRTDSAAVVEGSISSLGSQYVLGLRATNCRNGDLLDQEQVQAARKEDILASLSQIANTFRTRVGESLATIEKHSAPLPETTTSSLEALKAYDAGQKVSFSQGPSAAVPHFQRAVQIDPEFARAYAVLGITYSNLGESVRSMEATMKAYQLKDHASDRDRFFIATMYDRQVTGDLERERQTLESWAQTYPRDRDAPGLLAGFATTATGRYELSIEAGEKSIAIDPDATLAFGSIAFSQLHLNRLSDAEATLQRALNRKLDHPDFPRVRYFIAFLKNDRSQMSRWAAQAKGKPGVEDMMSHLESLAMAHAGRLEDAAHTIDLTIDLARQGGQKERAAMFEAAAADWEAFYGNAPAARRRADNALALSKGRDAAYAAAFALALSGESSRSRALADDLNARFPEDTCVQFIYLPTLRAQLSLNMREPAAAIQSLQAVSRFDYAQAGTGFNGFFGALYPVYVRGTAYLSARRPAEAAVEFQKVLDHPGAVLVDPMGAVARLQLARSLALAGDVAKAKSVYQDLLALWATGDGDASLIKQAKAEFARLQ
jgi:tetratricopeptide (TPR) repeat protein